MVSSTQSSTADAFIVSLDVASSGVHALLFDSGARHVEGYGAHLPSRPSMLSGRPPAAVREDLADLTIDCLDELHRQTRAAQRPIGAVVFSLDFGLDDAGTTSATPSPTPEAPAEDSASRSFSTLLFQILFGRGPQSQGATGVEPERDLKSEFANMWPGFAGAPWFRPLDAGACEAIGAGCVALGRFSVSVEPRAALRAVIEAPAFEVAPGLQSRQIDPRRSLVGSELKVAGVPAWMKHMIATPKDIEARLESASPGDHGLTLIPEFEDRRGAILGIGFATEPFHIYHATLEAVALSFLESYAKLCGALVAPVDLVASGVPLLRSPGWMQMIADALGRPVIPSTEPHPAARGAALLALERIGTIGALSALPASTGSAFDPRPEREASYAHLLRERRALYAKLFE